MKQLGSTGFSRRRLPGLAGVTAGATLLARQSLFAEQVGVSPTIVHTVGNSKNTSFASLKQIDARLLNVHLAPVLGSSAVAASPRVGHVHVRLDDAPWVWADASGNPIILMGLPRGPHKVLLELEDANHHTLDKGTVTFVVPEKNADDKRS